MLKNKKSNILVLLLLGCLLLAFSGCHTPAGRSTGEVVDDSTITAKVKAKLFDSDELSGFAISVSTFNQVVTLTGAVKTEEQKKLAEDLAESVRDVRGVNNNLEIK